MTLLMFANLVSTLHQVPGAIPKRPAQDMEPKDATEQFATKLTSATSKIWDNKQTPIKQLQRLATSESSEWQTPNPTPQQRPRTQGPDQETPQVAKRLSNLFLETGTDLDMSPSEDKDNIRNDSGNESTLKTLT
jgi:hypothetical protein